MVAASKKQNGFTIVELLIVIVVIAILAAISVVAYTGIQQRAHDSQRVQDIANIRKALELYKIENGQYPNTVATPGMPIAGWEASTASTFLNRLNSHMQPIPTDPVNDQTSHYAYVRNVAGSQGCPASAGSFYVLRINNLESLDGREISDLGTCKDSTSLSPSRTPTETQAVFFGFEGQ